MVHSMVILNSYKNTIDPLLFATGKETNIKKPKIQYDQMF